MKASIGTLSLFIQPLNSKILACPIAYFLIIYSIFNVKILKKLTQNSYTIVGYKKNKAQ